MRSSRMNTLQAYGRPPQAKMPARDAGGIFASTFCVKRLSFRRTSGHPMRSLISGNNASNAKSSSKADLELIGEP